MASGFLERKAAEQRAARQEKETSQTSDFLERKAAEERAARAEMLKRATIPQSAEPTAPFIQGGQGNNTRGASTQAQGGREGQTTRTPKAATTGSGATAAIKAAAYSPALYRVRAGDELNRRQAELDEMKKEREAELEALTMGGYRKGSFDKLGDMAKKIQEKQNETWSLRSAIKAFDDEKQAERDEAEEAARRERLGKLDIEAEKKNLEELKREQAKAFDERSRRINELEAKGDYQGIIEAIKTSPTAGYTTKVNQLEKDLKDAEKVQRENRYAELRNNADFEEKSRYNPEAHGEPKYNALAMMYMEDDNTLYRYVNKDKDTVGAVQANDSLNGASFAGFDRGFIEQMSDDEVKIFNYLYATEGKGAAEQFIKDISSDLNLRQMTANRERWEKLGRESPVSSSIFSVLTSPTRGLSYVGQALDYLEDGEIDTNAGYNKWSVYPTALRSGASEIVNEKWGPVGTFFYQTGMSMGDFLFNSLVTGGLTGGGQLSQNMALGIMGSGAAADQTISAKARGLSDGQAFSMGTIAGLAEIFTEKYSLDALLDGKWEENALKYILKNAFTEGTEEVGSDIINTFADLLIATDKSELNMAIEEGMKNGLTRGEAFGRAMGELAGDMGLDFLGGALSGGAMAGARVAIGNAKQSYAERAVGRDAKANGLENLLERAEALGPDSRASQMAEEMRKKLGKTGKKVSNSEAGKLALEVINSEARAKTETGNKKAATEAAESTAVNDDPTQHTEAEQAVIEEYKNAVDNRLADWIYKVKKAFAEGDTTAAKMRFVLNEVNNKTAEAVKKVCGVDVYGFKHMIDGSAVRHIEQRHGENGEANSSMKNVEDIARMQYVIDNFDNAQALLDKKGRPIYSTQYHNADNSRAPMIQFSKRVNGNYYVVEAVPDGADKKIHIVSAYMNENGRSVNQVLNMEENSPQLTPQTLLDTLASAENTISQPANEVKESAEEIAKKETAGRGIKAETGFIDEIIGDTEKLDKNSGAYKLGQEVKTKLERGETLTDYEAGHLLETYLKEAAREQQAVMAGENIQERPATVPTAVSENLDLETSAERYGVDEGTLETVKGLCEATGAEAVFYESETAGENGFYKDGIIHINTKSGNPAAQVFSHELTHSLENSGFYEYLRQHILSKIKAYGGDLEQLRADKKALYERHGTTLETDSEADFEIVAEYVEKHLLSDEAAIKDMVKEQRSLGERIKRFIDKVLAKLGNKEAAERTWLEKVRDIYRSALKESQTRSGEARQNRAEMEHIRDLLASGELSETEAEERMAEAYSAEADLRGDYNEGREEFSLNPDFADELDAWDGEGNKTFLVGTTSEALKSIGIDEKNIVWYGDKISKIMQKHSGMTKDIIKQVPEMLENPIVVLKSKQSESRVLIFGEVYDTKGAPVTAVLELLPISRGGEILNIQIIASAYGKDTNPAGLIRGSELLYIDGNKNRTRSWMHGLGLQLPSDTTASGSIGNITYLDGKVKIEGIPFEQYMRGEAGNTHDGQFSISEEAETGTETSAEADPQIVEPTEYERTTANLPKRAEGQFSISDTYADELNDWDRKGRPEKKVFVLGETGEVLQGLGAMEQDIYLRSEKINRILADHPEMTMNEIRRIPEILDDPVLVLKSRNEGRSRYGNSRLVMFGTVKNANGSPVMCILDLKPTEGGFLLDGMQKVNSAYVKTFNPVHFVENSEVLYADKKRTIPLLRAVGFNGPTALAKDGSIGSIAYDRDAVNLDGAPFNEVVRISENDGQFSISEAETEQATYETITAAWPRKARNYLENAVGGLVNDMGKALDIPTLGGTGDYMAPFIKAMSVEYFKKGEISETSMNEAFEEIYKGRDGARKEFYDKTKDFKDALRSTTPKTSAKRTGELYRQMTEKLPELFPEYIKRTGWQKRRIADVLEGIEACERKNNSKRFKEAARNDFLASVNTMQAELRAVKSYGDEAASKAEAKEAAKIKSPEKLVEAYDQLKQTRISLEKAKARNLLTEGDKLLVGRLLRGEIGIESVDGSKNNLKGIKAVFEAAKAHEQTAKALREYNAQIKSMRRARAEGFLETMLTWKDKRAGILYERETAERNIRDIIKDDPKLAERMIAAYFTPVHQSEANSTRMKREYRNRVRELKLSREVTAGNEVSEAYAVQFIGEAEDNIRMLEARRGGGIRDGKSLEDWQGAVSEFWKKNPNLDKAKIDNAVKEFKGIYDELFSEINKARMRNGYEPINYRSGYFPHFEKEGGEGLLRQLAAKMGIDTKIDNLPTTINGLTHTFKPGITWFSNAQQRKGYNTAYDALEGFDRYIEGAASVIWQTDNIQNLRALATQIRYSAGDDGLKEQIEKVEADTTLNEDQKRDKIENICKNGQYALSNFVVWLDEYTNLLANKKSRHDRGMEASIGRRSYQIMKNFESRVGANMVAANVGSALTNFIPLTQAWSRIDSRSMVKGLGETMRALRDNDGFSARSDFLTNRRGSDVLVQTTAQKWSAKAGFLMEFIDNFTSEAIVRARYNQNVSKGMSENNAMEEADAFAAGVMAGRSKGEMPVMFHASNPLIKAFTQFQLEVNNQWSEIMKDIPREFRGRRDEAIKAMFKYVIGAWLYNEIYEMFVGRRAALDPLDILADFGKDTYNEGIWDAIGGLAGNVVSELPFSSGIAIAADLADWDVDIDGGRIPVASAIPSPVAIFEAWGNDNWSLKKKLRETQKELDKLAYVLPPFGGNQAQKMIKSVKAVFKGGSYGMDKDGNDTLQYPVYTDTVGEFAGSLAKGVLFGKNSYSQAQEWVEGGFKSFNAKQTAAYQDMLDAGVRQKEAFKLISDMRGAGTNGEKLEVLKSSKVSDNGKAIAYYALVASDREREYLEELRDDELGKAVKSMMNVKESGGNTSRYFSLLEDGVDYATAEKVTKAIDELKPENGKKNVTELQKWSAVIKAVPNATRHTAALKSIMGDEARGRLEIAEKYNISAKTYVKFLEYRKQFDANGNGTLSSAETKQAIDSLGAPGGGIVLPGNGKVNLTLAQKAALWQLFTTSDAKKNPYSVREGQKVAEMKGK